MSLSSRGKKRYEIFHSNENENFFPKWRKSFVENFPIVDPMNNSIEFSLFILKYVVVVYPTRSFFMSAKTRNYDPMSEDGYDSKIPLYNDDVFQHGIQFNAKVRFHLISSSESMHLFLLSFFFNLVYWLIGSTQANQSGGNCCCYASYSRM